MFLYAAALSEKSRISINRSLWSGPSKRNLKPLGARVRITGLVMGAEGLYDISRFGYCSGDDFNFEIMLCSDEPRSSTRYICQPSSLRLGSLTYPAQTPLRLDLECRWRFDSRFSHSIDGIVEVEVVYAFKSRNQKLASS